MLTWSDRALNVSKRQDMYIFMNIWTSKESMFFFLYKVAKMQ
jgi:hypothetical protein